jgi:hypothetical protein
MTTVLATINQHVRHYYFRQRRPILGIEDSSKREEEVSSAVPSTCSQEASLEHYSKRIRILRFNPKGSLIPLKQRSRCLP